MFKRINLKYKSQFDRQVFGDRIREARMRLGYTQDQVADAVDPNKGGTFMSNIEAWNPAKKDEGSGTTIKAAVSIANALEVSLDHLCNRDDFINRPMTMGDVARVLMAISFLQGVELSEKKEPYTQVTYADNDVKFEHPQTKVKYKNVQSIRIPDGKLRHFLHHFQEMFDRPHAEDFYQMLGQRLKELDEICIWEELDKSKWRESLLLCDAQGYPREAAERIIWNSTPPPTE